MALGLSSYAACGIFLPQGSNLCLLHWQVASLSLSHQGLPADSFCMVDFNSIQFRYHGCCLSPKFLIFFFWIVTYFLFLFYISYKIFNVNFFSLFITLSILILKSILEIILLIQILKFAFMTWAYYKLSLKILKEIIQSTNTSESESEVAQSCRSLRPRGL